MNIYIKKILNQILLIFILGSLIIAQDKDNLFSSENRLLFGNYLFIQHDYLRAINEYEILQQKNWNDTLQFKIGLANYRMHKYSTALTEYDKISAGSEIIEQAALEKIRAFYQLGNYTQLREKISGIINVSSYKTNLLQLGKMTLLLDNSTLPLKKNFINDFNSIDKQRVAGFYDFKVSPPFKSEVKAGLLSALIPGLGKVYADETGDGITAFLLTGIFTYLSVNKFQNNHKASGWLYASIAAFFYAGNIYGSVAAVQNYNAGIRFNFENEVKLFIDKRNQFLPLSGF